MSDGILVPAHHRVLLAYLPYSPESDAIEDAIGKWLASPANLQHFEGHVHWTAMITITVHGGNKTGEKVVLISDNPVHLAGEVPLDLRSQTDGR